MPHTTPRSFDLIVIGSGSAAGSVASRCRSAGWTVAMVDKQPFGGTCALRGCDPKEVLVGAAAAVDAVRSLASKSLRAERLGNLFALAMHAGVTADALKTMTWAYPTNGSDTAYMV